MNEFELFQALRPHFPAREFALLPQVANGTGAGAFRHCDALALGLWPSRGLRLHGFEIKSYRGDWVRELRNPAKAEDIARYCNHWWIVTGSIGMVYEGELPPLWGLMEYDREQECLKRKIPAPYRDGLPVDLAFVAGMLRKAQEVVSPKAALTASYNAGMEAGKKEKESRTRYELEEYAKLKTKVAAFEKASGIKIAAGWHSGEQIGEAVNVVLNGSITKRAEELKRVAAKILEELACEPGR
jgi:hypothetical protein